VPHVKYLTLGLFCICFAPRGTWKLNVYAFCGSKWASTSPTQAASAQVDFTEQQPNGNQFGELAPASQAPLTPHFHIQLYSPTQSMRQKYFTIAEMQSEIRNRESGFEPNADQIT